MPRPYQKPGERREAGAGASEVRLYGLNACLAAFEHRPDSLRKLWLSEERTGRFRTIMAWCAKQRIGYRIVSREDLDRLTGSQHHEGVCMALEVPRKPALASWIERLPSGPVLALWLDGVGNPHNLGAILRSAAHFGVAGVLLPAGAELSVSGAAARVAEGGAEVVPLVAAGTGEAAFATLRAAGFTLAATVVRGGEALFDAALPERTVLVMGAESEGVDDTLASGCDVRLGIPGTGQVESLNVSAATAVFLYEWARRHR